MGNRSARSTSNGFDDAMASAFARRRKRPRPSLRSIGATVSTAARCFARRHHAAGQEHARPLVREDQFAMGGTGSKMKSRNLLMTAVVAIMSLPALSLSLGCHRAAVADKAVGLPSWNAKIVSEQEP